MSSLSLPGELDHKSPATAALAAAAAAAASVRYFRHNNVDSAINAVTTAVTSAVTALDGTTTLQCPPDILPPTSDEWESKRDIIEDLYIRKRLKLNEVKHRMETLHGFKANERMYKGRFKRWGLRKNHKRWREPASSSSSSPPEVVVAELQVPEESPSLSLVKRENVAVPKVILHADLESQLKEEIFLSISHVADTFYDEPATPSPERYAIANFTALTRLGLRQIALKNHVFGSRMLTKASALLEEIYPCRDPPNIINMCFVLPALMIRLGQTDIFKQYIANLWQMARSDGAGSPIHQIAIRLSRLHSSNSENLDALLIHLSNSSITIYLEKERSRKMLLTKPPWDTFPNSESDLMISIESVHNLQSFCGPAVQIAPN